MARTTEFGIVVVARDATKGVFGAVTKASKALFKGMKSGSASAGKNFAQLGKIATGLRAGISLISGAFRMVSGALGSFTDAAIAQRGAGDKQRKDMEKFDVLMKKVSGTIGDVLVPIIMGVRDAMTPVLKAFGKWMEANRKIVGGKLIEWLAKGATLLVDGIAFGVSIVSKAWSGWQMIIGVVSAAISSFYAMALDGISALLGKMGGVANAFGMDGLAGKIKTAQGFTKGLSGEFKSFADESMKDVHSAIRDQEDLDATIRSVSKTIKATIGDAAVKAHDRLNESIKKIPPNYAKLLAAAKRVKAELFKDAQLDSELDAMFDEWDAKDEEWLRKKAANIAKWDAVILAGKERMYQQALAIEKRQIAESEKHISATVGMFQSAASAITSSWSTAFSDIGRLQNETTTRIITNEKGMLEEQEIITGQHVKTLGDAFGDFFTGLGKMMVEAAAQWIAMEAIKWAATALFATKEITATAAVTAAESYKESVKSMGLYGLIAGIGIAAAAFATVLALTGSFHEGGIVPGQGDQLALVEGGERIISKADVQAGGGSGAPTINLTIKNLVPMDREETARQLEESLLPILREWSSAGRLG